MTDKNQSYTDTGTKACADLDALRKQGREILKKIVEEPEFRDSLRREPVDVLRMMGITLSPEFEAALQDGLKLDPDLLVHAMVCDDFKTPASVDNQARSRAVKTFTLATRITIEGS